MCWVMCKKFIDDLDGAGQDPYMILFTCEFTKILNQLVELPCIEDEETVFDANHNQTKALKIKDKKFVIEFN